MPLRVCDSATRNDAFMHIEAVAQVLVVVERPANPLVGERQPAGA